MAEYTLIQAEKLDTLKSSKPLQCRFHDTEEYQIFCKDCKDFMCFKCLGQLHQKHDLSPLQDAEEDIRKEMEDLLFGNKYTEQLNSFSDKVSDKEKELVQDEECLKHEIISCVNKMKKNIDLAEERLLSMLRNTFESFQISLQERKTNINNLQIDIANLDVNKIPECSLSHIIHSLSEIKLCSSTCDKLINHPKPGFQPTMEFSIGNFIQTSWRKCDSSALTLSPFSTISTQTDFFEDSDNEWFDAEDREEDDVIERSSDELTDEYPIKFQTNQDLKLISKIVPISEKNAWIISNRKLLKIVDHSLQEDVYEKNVDDIVVLKDGCVLVLRTNEIFIMKLLQNKRLVRFADVEDISCYPNCICIRGDIVVVYLWSVSANSKNVYTSRNHIIWMNTDGIVTKRTLFFESGRKRPYSIQNLESGLCVLYHVNCDATLHSIKLLDAKSDKCDMLYTFNGTYGLNPERNFECKGTCVDRSGNILVSDHRHHSVYVLDKELKYNKTLFDARNGLDKPAAISLLNDQLWVADGNQMFIFKYANM